MKKFELNVEELSYICGQMNIILNSGLTIQEGLEVLLEDVTSAKAKELLESLYQDISDKKSLYKALKRTKAFPGYMINMVRIGEITGRLEEVFMYLARYYENEANMRKTIKTVLFQPIILLFMMFLIVCVLVTKIIPTFERIFDSLNLNLDYSFARTMGYSNNTGLAVMIILATIIVMILVGGLLLTFNKGRALVYSILDSCVLTRDISIKLARARFSKAMAVMIRSGVDTTEAVSYAKALVTSKRYKKKIDNCYKKLIDNNGFVESIVEEKLFDNMNNQMLKVSYKTGNYEGTWEKISKMHDEELQESVIGMVQSIEPIIVTVLTVTIGAILISVMLPLIGIMSQIR